MLRHGDRMICKFLLAASVRGKVEEGMDVVTKATYICPHGPNLSMVLGSYS